MMASLQLRHQSSCVVVFLQQRLSNKEWVGRRARAILELGIVPLRARRIVDELYGIRVVETVRLGHRSSQAVKIDLQVFSATKFVIDQVADRRL